MSHYRKIDVRIWNDAKFNSLDLTGKLAFFMLLTHPMMTAIGAMRATIGGLADEMGCRDEGKRDAFRDAIADIISKGMAEHDEKASLIALPNFLKYNPPGSVNAVKSWATCLEWIPESPLKDKSIQRAVAFALGMSKGFRDAIPDAMRYPENREQRAETHNKKHNHKQDAKEDTYTREHSHPGYVDEDGVIHDDSGTYENWPEFEEGQQ